ncbi:hypothetical protein I79_020046 [Cricetulus griseus]|uniref:Uncharacterized protein n=1 Tax=Cricetulus griseus TaxID=10029 RepID=G3I913_CRIGR|nr:hypothetical protein I79_020046 [Cricetulus griseus]
METLMLVLALLRAHHVSSSLCSPELGSNSFYVNSLHEVTAQHLVTRSSTE